MQWDTFRGKERQTRIDTSMTDSQEESQEVNHLCVISFHQFSASYSKLCSSRDWEYLEISEKREKGRVMQGETALRGGCESADEEEEAQSLGEERRKWEVKDEVKETVERNENGNGEQDTKLKAGVCLFKQ